MSVALVVLLEFKDASFKTADEFRTLFKVPVLATVPLMLSDVDKRRVRRRKWALGVGLGSTVMASVAVLVYTLVR